MSVKKERISSIDLFRGLAVFGMFLSSRTPPKLPWWLYHAYHTGNNLLQTYVDMVVPAFLMAAGMSIPYALSKQMEKGKPMWQLVLLIFKRSLLLIWIGAIFPHNLSMRHTMFFSIADPGWKMAVWRMLVPAAVILFLLPLPLQKDSSEKKPVWSWVVHLLSLAVMIWATFVMRTSSGGTILTGAGSPHAPAFVGSVLGRVGFGYLTAALVWLTMRKTPFVRIGIYGLMICLVIHFKQSTPFLTQWAPGFIRYTDPCLRLAWLPSIVLMGTFLGDLMKNSVAGITQQLRLNIFFIGVGLLIAATLVSPDFYRQINNVRKLLFQQGVCVFVFWLILEIEYWFKHKKTYSIVMFPFVQLGKNPFFAYMIGAPFLGILSILKQLGIIKNFFFGMEGWWAFPINAIPYLALLVFVVWLANRNKLFLRV